MNTRRFEISDNGRVWDITDPNNPKLAGVMPAHVRTIESALRILQIVRPGCGVLSYVAKLCRLLKNDDYADDLESLDREIEDAIEGTASARITPRQTKAGVTYGHADGRTYRRTGYKLRCVETGLHYDVDELEDNPTFTVVARD